MLYYVIAVAVTLVISVPVTFVVTSAYRKKETETKIGNAEEKARRRQEKGSIFVHKLRRKMKICFWT